MEYSHYAAKAAYQRHTQHGGGKSKKSPLEQTYQHWYRIIQHRFQDMEKLTKENLSLTEHDRATITTQIERRREASALSSAATHAALWRQKCDRIASKWVPRPPDLA